MQSLRNKNIKAAKYSRIQFRLTILFLSFFLTQIGCKKFIQIDAPNTQLVTENVFNNSSTATSALINIYQQMYNNYESYYMALQTGILGDELTNYSSSTQNIQQYTNSMQSTTIVFGPWGNAYNYIYQANAIIEGLQNNPAINESIKKQLIGESKFIRAFWHFYLTNCYGDIPIVLSTNYSINASIKRSPKKQVFGQIIADLQDAQGLLNVNFVDASDTTVSLDRVRPTKWAATALLARAYLYNGDYSNAEIQSASVIANSGMFSMVDDLSKVFLKNSNEAIWQLGIPLPNTYNTADGYFFILQGAPNDASNQPQSISQQLINAFELGDKRKTNWIGSYITTSSPVDTFYYPFKYKEYNSVDIKEYNMILRLGEQYLIRAEARANGAGVGINGAIDDLNVIRSRAGLANYTGSIDKSSVLAAILHERQVELFTEWGHRWFDLSRTNNIDFVMGSPGNVCQLKGGTWNSNWQLFPIPQSERNNDPNLTQNPGY